MPCAMGGKRELSTRAAPREESAGGCPLLPCPVPKGGCAVPPGWVCWWGGTMARHHGHSTMGTAPQAWHNAHGTTGMALWARYHGHSTMSTAPKAQHHGHGTMRTAPRAQHRGHGTMGTAPRAQHHEQGQEQAPSSRRSSLYVTAGAKPRGAGQPIFIRNARRRYETSSFSSKNGRQRRAGLLQEAEAERIPTCL